MTRATRAERPLTSGPATHGALASSWWVAVLLLAAVAVLLRVRLLEVGFSGDEAATAWTLTQPLGEALRWVREVDTHPPLHYLLLRPWAALFGTGTAALRWPSVLLEAGTVVVTALAGRRLRGPVTGLAAATAVVVAPALLADTPVARMYALATFAAAVAVLGAAGIARSGPAGGARPAWVLTGGVVLASWSQTGIGVQVGLASLVVLALAGRGAAATAVRAWWRPALAMAVLAPAWLLVAPAQLGNAAGLDWIPPATLPRIYDEVSGIVTGHLRVVPWWAASAELAVVAISVAGALRDRRVRLLAIATGAAVGSLVAVSLVGPSLLIGRALVWAVPWLAVVVAGGVAALWPSPAVGAGPRRVAVALAALLVVVPVVRLGLLEDREHGPEVPAVLRALHDAEGWLVVQPNSYEFLWQRYRDEGRVGPVLRSFPVPPTEEWDARPGPADRARAATLAALPGDVWVLDHDVAAVEVDPFDVLDSTLRSSGRRPTVVEEVRSMQLTRWSREG